MRRRERYYFFTLGLACCAAASLGIWLLPLAAFVLLECGYTAAERLSDAVPRRTPLLRPAALPAIGSDAAAGRVERAA